MSNSRKQAICGITSLSCTVVMAFCIWNMILPGLAGDARRVKLYFIPIIPAAVAGVVAGVGYYYYRSKRTDDMSSRADAEITALASAGRKTPKK